MPLRSQAASALILALAATAAAAQSGVPTLNLGGTCRALDRKDFSIQIDPQRCLKTENEARAKLADDWTKILRRGPFTVHTDRPDGRRGKLCAAADLPRAAARPCGRTVPQNQTANRPAAGTADADPSDRSARPIAYARSSRASLTCDFHCDMLSAMIFTEVIATWLSCA